MRKMTEYSLKVDIHCLPSAVLQSRQLTLKTMKQPVRGIDSARGGELVASQLGRHPFRTLSHSPFSNVFDLDGSF